MSKTLLVGPDVDEGRKFLDLLKREKVPVSAALWQSNESGDRWDLAIVTPVAKELGPVETYRRLRDILEQSLDRPEVDLLNVSVFSPDQNFAKGLRRHLRRVKEFHVTSQPLGDYFIPNGWVYFVK